MSKKGNTAEEKNELILAQNQYAFTQDETKGTVQVMAPGWGKALKSLSGSTETK